MNSINTYAYGIAHIKDFVLVIGKYNYGYMVYKFCL